MDQLKQKRIRTAQVIARIVQSAFSLPYRQLMVPSIDAASCVAGISPAPAPSACRIVIALEYSTIFLLGAAILSGRASWRHSTPLRQRSAGATAAGARRQALVQAGRQCLSQERQGQPPGPPHCCQAHFLASWLHEWRRCARWSTLVLSNRLPSSAAGCWGWWWADFGRVLGPSTLSGPSTQQLCAQKERQSRPGLVNASTSVVPLCRD